MQASIDAACPRRPQWAPLAGAAGLLGLVAALAAPAAAGQEELDVELGVGDPRAGTTETVEVTVDNAGDEEDGALLDAVDIRLPDGFVWPDDVAPTVDPSDAAHELEVDDGGLVVEGLGVAPGEAIVVEFDVVLACQGPGGDQTPAFLVTGAAPDNGPLGPEDGVEAALELDGACELAFDRHPADAEVDESITSERAEPEGEPVRVEVLDADGERTVAPVSVGLELAEGTGPPGAALEGGGDRDAEGGLVAFPELTIDVADRGYELVAASERAEDSEPSEPFQVWELIEACEPDEPCAAALETEGMASELRAGEGDRLFSSISAFEDEALEACQEPYEDPYPFQHAPLTAIVDSEGVDGPKEIVLRIDAEEARGPGMRGMAWFQVCFEALVPPGEDAKDFAFVPRDPSVTTPSHQPPRAAGPGAGPPRGNGPGSGNGPGGESTEPTLGPALLPDCERGGEPTPPCVAARTGAPGGGVEITVVLPEHDPMLR